MASYKRGRKKPRGDRPLLRRASLMRVNMPASVGVDALVPPVSPQSKARDIRCSYLKERVKTKRKSQLNTAIIAHRDAERSQSREVRVTPSSCIKRASKKETKQLVSQSDEKQKNMQWGLSTSQGRHWVRQPCPGHI